MPRSRATISVGTTPPEPNWGWALVVARLGGMDLARARMPTDTATLAGASPRHQRTALLASHLERK